MDWPVVLGLVHNASPTEPNKTDPNRFGLGNKPTFWNGSIHTARRTGTVPAGSNYPNHRSSPLDSDSFTHFLSSVCFLLPLLSPFHFHSYFRFVSPIFPHLSFNHFNNFFNSFFFLLIFLCFLLFHAGVSFSVPPMPVSDLSSRTTSLRFSTDRLHFPTPSYLIFIYWFIFVVF